VWRGRPRSRLGKDSEVRASPELIHSLPDYVSGSLSIAQMVKNLRLLSQVRRRRVSAWTRLCPAGVLAIGGFGRSRWRLRRTRRVI
jgi:hypothetical protein